MTTAPRGGAGTPQKVDLRRRDPLYRAGRGRFDVVEVPDAPYLMVDGAGDPNTSPDFAAAVETLYPVAYALKFAVRAALGRDHVVAPLEGLWRADDMAAFTTARDKRAWSWTLMLRTPDGAGRTLVDAAVERAGAKDAPMLDALRWETLSEGTCVQTLHVGSFDDEGPVLARMHDDVIPSRGLRMTGVHHEIYLSDFRRVPPERRRTILRQPVAPA